MLSSTSMFVAETHFTEQPSKVATDCCCPCCCWNCDAATTDGSRNGFYRRVAILDCGFLVLSGFFPFFSYKPTWFVRIKNGFLSLQKINHSPRMLPAYAIGPGNGKMFVVSAKKVIVCAYRDVCSTVLLCTCRSWFNLDLSILGHDISYISMSFYIYIHITVVYIDVYIYT
jgi:hypothetical protein